MAHPRLCAATVACLLAVASLAASAADPWLRGPALHGDTVVFTAEGDLWSASLRGGNAQRLTTHAGEESRAAISPDGRWLAFSATYEGPVEAYVMPLAGGTPRRISFENTRASVLGWTPDGEVLVQAQADAGPSWSPVVLALAVDGSRRRALPLADANDAAVSADGRWLYFVRFGLAATNDNARGYRGGALAQLWRYALDGSGGEAERIGPREANLRRPMPVGDRVLVIADGDGLDNLWSLAADGSDARPLTAHRDFPVRTAHQQGGRVAYQHGADLRLFDLADGSDRLLRPQLASDFEQRRERWIDDPLRYLEDAVLSPRGDLVALTARGRVLLAGTGNRRRVEIAAPDGVRLRAAVPAHDGSAVYAIADAGDREEVWRFAADGSSEASALTRDGSVRRWSLHPSPDGRWLAHDDKRGRLWLTDLRDGGERLIDDGGPDGNEGIAELAWSADGRYLALVRQTAAVSRNRIALIDIERGRRAWLTSDKYDSGSPAFSPDGRWLWFLSEREFRLGNGSPWGDRNTGPQFDQRTRVYALALQPGLRFPFLPDDELSPPPSAAADDAAKSGDARGARGRANETPALPAPVWAGLEDRLYEVPLPAGNYGRLRASKDRLYVLERSGAQSALKYLPIDNKESGTTTVHANVADYGLSADGSRLFIRLPDPGEGRYGALLVADAAHRLPDDLARITVRLDDWRLRIDPAAEWRQLFDDAWRMHRDHFYDDGLRGVDWAAVRERYRPLLARVGDRDELDDLLAQMMAELGALHSQIVPGDVRRGRDGARVAFLGARFERVPGRGWRVAHILRTEAELPSQRGPLQAPGVDVRVGDIIRAINGRETATVRDLSDLLRDQAGRQVLLEVVRGDAEPRRVLVVPVDAAREVQLRHGDWVLSRRERVEAAGAGRIGYLHLQAMGGSDMAAFVREFYGQFDRDGLIIDVRRNRGGNIDSWIIEKLMRRAWAFWQRPGGRPYTNMQQAFRGHLVVLADALTYSDGETFAAGVQRLGLGPVIGTRTAGAGVWLSDGNRLADRGRARVAEFPQYGLDGSWLVEGVGVDPDVVVDNPPHASFNGGDAQLEAALDWLARKLAQEPVPALQPRAIPPLPRANPADPD